MPRICFGFCAFYGLVHIYLPNASSGIGGADGERYAANFEYLAHQDISWETLSNTFYGGGQNNNDILSLRYRLLYRGLLIIHTCCFARLLLYSDSFIRAIYGIYLDLRRIS